MTVKVKKTAGQMRSRLPQATINRDRGQHMYSNK